MNNDKKRFLRGKSFAISAVAVWVGLAVSMPALAETEIEALKRELAEQKEMIRKILAAQESQKVVNAKVEAQAAEAKGAVASAVSGNTFTFYGVLDGGVEHISNVSKNAAGTAGSEGLTRVPNITGTLPSRLGVNVAREVRPGYKAIATVEAGFNLDDGTSGQGSRIFGRQLFGGIETPVGSFTLGRQNSMIVYGMSSDLLGPNIYSLGSFDAYLPNARFDNSLAWRAKFDKISLGALYSFGRDTKGGTPASGTCAGEEVGDPSRCKGWSAMARYDDKAFGLSLAMDEQKGGTGAAAYFFNGAAPLAFTGGSDSDRRIALGGYANLGKAKLGLGWLGRKVDAAAGTFKSNTYYVNAAYSLSQNFAFDGGVYRITNDDQDRDATLAVARVFYHWDQNLSNYLQIGHISNSSKARYALSVGAGVGPVAGDSQTGVMAGVRYRF